MTSFVVFSVFYTAIATFFDSVIRQSSTTKRGLLVNLCILGQNNRPEELANVGWTLAVLKFTDFMTKQKALSALNIVLETAKIKKGVKSRAVCFPSKYELKQLQRFESRNSSRLHCSMQSTTVCFINLGIRLQPKKALVPPP